MSETWQGALDYLYGLANWETRPPGTTLTFELDRIRRLLADLGDPQEAWPAVHVAGTNGKGSTAAMAAAILRRAGYRVGLYTSPHLHTVRERVQVDGRLVSEEEVMEWLVAHRARLDAQEGLTTFEALTALAFAHFAQRRVDVAVIEVGLGGRLDTTNVVRPVVSIVTAIGLDHTEVLGRTVGEIAADKAGILRTGVPVICAPQPPEARAVLDTAAAAIGAPVVAIADRAAIGPATQLDDAQRFEVRVDAGGGPQTYAVELPLVGPHQRVNAACALAAARRLAEDGWAIDRADCEAGLASVRWPGRFERLGTDPTVVVDGAHNPPAAAALKAAYRERFGSEPCHLVLGVSRDKDAEGLLRELAPLAATVTVTRSEHVRAMAPHTLAEAVRARGFGDVRVAARAADALEAAIARAGPSGIVLATGSIFLAADVREAWAERGRMPMPPRDPPPEAPGRGADS